jgi:hypothetical protein
VDMVTLNYQCNLDFKEVIIVHYCFSIKSFTNKITKSSEIICNILKNQ